jgi:phosphatidylglycerophosphatase A
MARLAREVSTLGPLGRIAHAPGTAGALAAAVVGYGVAAAGGAAVAVLGACVTIMGQWAVLARGDVQDDPREVVVDEAAGQLVAVLGVRPDMVHFITALILFRLFDVWKPWPIRVVERKGGVWAVMGDDLAAGCAARIVLLGIDACL